MDTLEKLKQYPNISIKKQIILTGTLLLPLRTGVPAVYLHHGKRCQTTKVLRILEAAPDYVVFETRCLLYTIRSDHPAENQQSAA